MPVVEHQSERVKMARWITSYISQLTEDTPWIEGHDMITKAIDNLATMFW